MNQDHLAHEAFKDYLVLRDPKDRSDQKAIVDDQAGRDGLVRQVHPV